MSVLSGGLKLEEELMMSNVKEIRRKPVYINLGGNDYQMKYTLNTFADMEELYGSVDEAIEAMEKGSIKAVRYMIFKGLEACNPDLTEVEVGAMIDITSLQSITEKMSEIMQVDMPTKEEPNHPNK